MLCVGVGTVVGVGFAKCLLVCHGCWVSGTICCSFFCERREVMWLPFVVIVLFWVLCCLRTV